MNRWKAVAIVLGATSTFWLILSFGVIAYSLEHGVGTWPTSWFVLFVAPCSVAYYISYRCVKKSHSIKRKKMEPALRPPLRTPSAPPPTPPPIDLSSLVDQSIDRCPSCRAGIQAGVLFCSKCGIKITEARKLESDIRHYESMCFGAPIMFVVCVFWVLVMFYFPEYFGPSFAYSYMICLLGTIVWPLVFLYSKFKLTGLKRTRKKR